MSGFNSDDHDCVRCRGRFPLFMFLVKKHGYVCLNCRNKRENTRLHRKSKPFSMTRNPLTGRLETTLKTDRRLSVLKKAEGK